MEVSGIPYPPNWLLWLVVVVAPLLLAAEVWILFRKRK